MRSFVVYSVLLVDLKWAFAETSDEEKISNCKLVIVFKNMGKLFLKEVNNNG